MDRCINVGHFSGSPKPSALVSKAIVSPHTVYDPPVPWTLSLESLPSGASFNEGSQDTEYRPGITPRTCRVYIV